MCRRRGSHGRQIWGVRDDPRPSAPVRVSGFRTRFAVESNSPCGGSCRPMIAGSVWWSLWNGYLDCAAPAQLLGMTAPWPSGSAFSMSSGIVSCIRTFQPAARIPLCITCRTVGAKAANLRRLRSGGLCASGARVRIRTPITRSPTCCRLGLVIQPCVDGWTILSRPAGVEQAASIHLQEGLCLIGYLRSEIGLGQAASQSRLRLRYAAPAGVVSPCTLAGPGERL